jgi:hypothetical protein
MIDFKNIQSYQEMSNIIRKKIDGDLLSKLERMAGEDNLDSPFAVPTSLIEDAFQTGFMMESLPNSYIDAVYWEKSGFPPNQDNYQAMISSKIIPKKGIFSPKYNPLITVKENFDKARSDWAVMKGKINDYVEKQKEIEDACGIITINIKL